MQKGGFCPTATIGKGDMDRYGLVGCVCVRSQKRGFIMIASAWFQLEWCCYLHYTSKPDLQGKVVKYSDNTVILGPVILLCYGINIWWQSE